MLLVSLFLLFRFFFLSFFCVSVYLVGGKFNCVTSSSAIAGIPGKKRKKTSYFLFFLYFSFYISFLLSRLGHSEMWVCSKHIYVHAHARVENDDQLVCPFFFHFARRLVDDGTLSRCCCVFWTRNLSAAARVTCKATSLVITCFFILLFFLFPLLLWLSLPIFFHFSTFHSLCALSFYKANISTSGLF